MLTIASDDRFVAQRHGQSFRQCGQALIDGAQRSVKLLAGWFIREVMLSNAGQTRGDHHAIEQRFNLRIFALLFFRTHGQGIIGRLRILRGLR